MHDKALAKKLLPACFWNRVELDEKKNTCIVKLFALHANAIKHKTVNEREVIQKKKSQKIRNTSLHFFIAVVI